MRLTSKSFVTNVTDVGLLFGVNPYVLPQLAVPMEAFIAHVTGEGPFSCVGYYMLIVM